MKKILAFVFITALSFSVFAGEKTAPAVMLQNQGGLYVEENGEMVWKKSIDAGTELEIVLDSETGNKLPKVTESKRTVSKKLIDCKMYSAVYEGKKYFVLNDRVVLNETVGVVLKDCGIYRSADICDIKDSNLDRGDIITFGQLYLANGKFNLVKISYFDNINYVVRNGYIKTSNKSSNKDDLKAIRMVAKIKAAKDEDVRNELLKSVKKLNCSSEIKALLIEVEDSFKEPDLQADGFTDVNEYMQLIDNSGDTSNINVRDIPGTKGTVIGQFELSEPLLYVTQRTNAQDTIGSNTNYWYYVQSQVSDIAGWVFGEFLTYAE